MLCLLLFLPNLSCSCVELYFPAPLHAHVRNVQQFYMLSRLAVLVDKGALYRDARVFVSIRVSCACVCVCACVRVCVCVLV